MRRWMLENTPINRIRRCNTISSKPGIIGACKPLITLTSNITGRGCGCDKSCVHVALIDCSARTSIYSGTVACAGYTSRTLSVGGSISWSRHEGAGLTVRIILTHIVRGGRRCLCNELRAYRTFGDSGTISARLSEKVTPAVHSVQENPFPAYPGWHSQVNVCPPCRFGSRFTQFAFASQLSNKGSAHSLISVQLTPSPAGSYPKLH